MPALRDKFATCPLPSNSFGLIFGVYFRRANEAIQACAQILNEHGSNAGLPTGPGVFLRLEVNQEMGLTFAIEACARKIAEEMNDHFQDLGVNWLDDICPEVTAEAQSAAELQYGEITLADFEKRARK